MRPKATGSGSTHWRGSKVAGSGPSPSPAIPCLVYSTVSCLSSVYDAKPVWSAFAAHASDRM